MTQRIRCRRGLLRPDRRGSLMVEAAAALMMLAVAMTLTLKVVGWVALEHRATDRRQRALSEAANLMERMVAIPFDELATDAVTPLSISSGIRDTLPGAELDLGVAGDDPVGGPGSKRVSVRIRWRNRAGDWDSPVLLTTWVYRSPSK